MPELPEVETIKNDLAPVILGKRIHGIELLWQGIVKEPSPAEFLRGVAGQKVSRIERRGKYLLIGLGSGKTLIIHLKMSGALLLAPKGSPAPDYTRAVIAFEDGSVVFFKDPRKFGMMKLVDDPELVVGKLGPEPLDAVFTPEVLAGRLHGKQAPIKAVLCDQEVIAGVGNMYADEALFAAKIHPTTAAGSLTKARVRRLYAAIRETLSTAIANKGASTRDYCRPDGTKGRAHDEFKVAHHRGGSCPNCSSPLSYIKVRGRGTYFCDKCQK